MHYFIKVSEIDAEYFPPREDVILQNEAPTDLYILVSGAVVRQLNSYLLHDLRMLFLQKLSDLNFNWENSIVAGYDMQC